MNQQKEATLDNGILIEKGNQYLRYLCEELPTRQVGSAGNRAATDFAARILSLLGYDVSQPGFSCIDWQTQGATCRSGSHKFRVFSSPYSLGCQVSGQLCVVSSRTDLESKDFTGQILLMRGELTREQLVPKNFNFYTNPDHEDYIRLLEEKKPLAIITATTRDPDFAGAVYPFPLFEDGDFDIPSVYTTAITGEKIARLDGELFHLVSQAERLPSTGCNVQGVLNPQAAQKVVLCAHIDAKLGSPGAVDNASGVAALLLIAELLRHYAGNYGIEVLVMNGEDYYGANGEKLFLSQNRLSSGNIRLFINLDGVGYRRGKTAFSFYNFTEESRLKFLQVLSRYPGLVEGEPWYQSDHAIAAINRVPAFALTTSNFREMEERFAHTARDVPALVDMTKNVEIAEALGDVLNLL